MSKEVCKAKEPYFCRFHGAEVYKRVQKNIIELKTMLNDTKEYEYASYLRKSIAKQEAALDASAGGFKKLTKDFERARKKESVEVQAYFASRLKKATELRLEDGNGWSDAQRDTRLFASKVLEASVKSADGTIRIPMSLTGSASIGQLYSGITKAGLEVTKLEVHPFNHSKINTKEELKEVEKQALAWVRDPENDPSDVYTGIEETGCGVRGLSFLDKSGREFTVIGSHDAE